MSILQKNQISQFLSKNIKIRNTRFVLTSERYIFQQPLIITQSTIPHIFYYSVLKPEFTEKEIVELTKDGVK